MTHPVQRTAGFCAALAWLISVAPAQDVPRGRSGPRAVHSDQRAPIVGSGVQIERGVLAAPERAVFRDLAGDSPAPIADVAAGKHSRIHHDIDADGVLWARGADYKASASRSGFTFIPFLGSDAPRNYPVSFRLGRIARGGAPIELGAAASVDRAGDRLVLGRPGIEARYDLALDSAEQSFALNVPAGAGDLTVSLDVETDLHVAARDGGFRFSCERGGVDYGAAIVFDSWGLKAEVISRWNGAGIDLVVPASFLEQARGQVVIDPILSTFTIDTFTNDLQLPDVAYDVVNDRYFVVYQDVFSFTDYDVYSVFVDGATNQVSGGAYVESGNVNWRRPSVAVVRGPGRFLVVAEAPSATQLGATDIVARFRNVADNVFDPAVILKGARPEYECLRPDIGGESVNFTASHFCLTYERDYGSDKDVVAIVIDADGNYVGTEIELATFVSRDEGWPRVSKSTGTSTGATQFCLSWTVSELTTGRVRADACLLRFDGGAIQGPFSVTPFSATEIVRTTDPSELSPLRHPTTQDQYWLVAVNVDLDPGAFNFELISRMALCSGTTVHSLKDLHRMEHVSEDLDQSVGAMATTDSTFQFASLRGETFTTEFAITILQPVVDRLGVTERRLDVAEGYSFGSASKYSGGGASEQSLFAYTTYDFATNEGDIFGAVVESESSLDAAGYQFCFSEPNATGGLGFMQAFGDRSRTSPQALAVSGLPPNTFGILIGSLSSGSSPNPLGEGSLCVAGSIGRFPVFSSGPNGQYTASLDPRMIPQPSGFAAAGIETWYFQAWHRDTNSSGPSSNLTNGVAIPFR